jgi:DNA ligase-1
MLTKRTLSLLYLLASLCLSAGQNQADIPAPDLSPEKPPLMLAKPYRSDIELSHYWVSEKLDGVRAYWDGAQFISRQGNRFSAPKWFTADFPQIPLDGELWMGRNRFAELSGAVRRHNPDHQQWQNIRFMVFDLPSERGNFDHRLAALSAMIDKLNTANIVLIKQYKIHDEAELMHELDQVITNGGEGLMLHLGSASYRSIRSDDLLKLKRFDDAEAIVVAHIEGKGKFTNMLGALVVKTPEGREFKIGSGLSDLQRRDPPHHHL